MTVLNSEHCVKSSYFFYYYQGKQQIHLKLKARLIRSIVLVPMSCYMENMKLKMSRGNAGKKREEKIFKYIVLVAQSCPTLCDPTDIAHQAPLSMGISSKKTGVDRHSHLQGLFLTQGSNSCLRHCRQILYHLKHQGSPI